MIPCNINYLLINFQTDMRKLLIFMTLLLSFIMLSLVTNGQRWVRNFEVPNKTTAFGEVLMVETVVYEIDSNRYYKLEKGFSAASTMADVFTSTKWSYATDEDVYWRGYGTKNILPSRDTLGSYLAPLKYFYLTNGQFTNFSATAGTISTLTSTVGNVTTANITTGNITANYVDTTATRACLVTDTITGMILKAANGTYWRLRASPTGVLTAVSYTP